MAAVDRFSSFARSLSSIHLQDNNMPFEGRGNTLRRSNNRVRVVPRSKSPTSTAFEVFRNTASSDNINMTTTALPFPATDRCRAAVTFAPLPTSCDQSKDTKLKQRRRHRATGDDSSPTPTVSCAGFRRDYKLGETLRSPSHMIASAQPTSEENMNMDSLQKHDFAFIKRSDGSYTYAILACIDEDGERMTFVLNTYGSTKVVRKRHWEKLVCLVSV